MIGSSKSSPPTSCSRVRRAFPKASASSTRSSRARTVSRSTPRSGRKFNRDRPGQQACGLRVAEQPPYRLAPAFAVVQRQIVHVHANERIGPPAIEAASKLHGVIDGFLAVIET